MVHIVRHRRFKGNSFAGFRMDKAQAVGMQGLARAEGFDGFFNRVAARVAQVAVNRVGGQRMVGFAHMDADLVGAASFERAFDVAVCQITF